MQTKSELTVPATGEGVSPRLAWMKHRAETGSANAVVEHFGISAKTFYKWQRIYAESGNDPKSLFDRSRRPHHSPHATPEPHRQLLKRLHEQTGFDQRRLKTILQEKHNITISERTIWKILKQMDLAAAVAEGSADAMPAVRL